MRKLPPAKSSTVAITRALKSVGLKPGVDFRVTGHNDAGVRLYTFAYSLTLEAGRAMADNADAIETAAAAEGFPFKVSVRYYEGSVLRNGTPQPSVRIDNDVRTERVRETPPAPVAEEPANTTKEHTMRNMIDFNDVDLHNDVAGHVMPGDWFDTGCGVGGHSFKRVVSIRYIEDNRPHGKDRVEFTFDVPAHSWAPTSEMFADRAVCFGRPRA